MGKLNSLSHCWNEGSIFDSKIQGQPASDQSMSSGCLCFVFLRCGAGGGTRPSRHLLLHKCHRSIPSLSVVLANFFDMTSLQWSHSCTNMRNLIRTNATCPPLHKQRLNILNTRIKNAGKRQNNLALSHPCCFSSALFACFEATAPKKQHGTSRTEHIQQKTPKLGADNW